MLSDLSKERKVKLGNSIFLNVFFIQMPEMIYISVFWV